MKGGTMREGERQSEVERERDRGKEESGSLIGVDNGQERRAAK